MSGLGRGIHEAERYKHPYICMADGFHGLPGQARQWRG